MNCDDYLSMLSTLPVGELAYGDARAHAMTCRDCDRVTRVVAERERNMMMAFGEMYPPVAAQPIAVRALELSRRRQIAFYSRIALGLAAVVAVFLFIAVRRVVPTPIAGVTEVFPLRCLSADQALAMLRATVSENTSISGRTNGGVGVVEVTTSGPEMQRVRSLLDRYDSPGAARCAAEVAVPTVPRTP